MPGVPEAELAEAAQMSSLADETPEGRSIVVLAKKYGIREHEMSSHEASFVPFSAETRMSGVDVNGRRLRKGAGDAIISLVESEGGSVPPELQKELDRIGREGGTPLAVAQDSHVLGVIYLKDVVKEGMSAPLRPAPGDGHQDRDDHGRQPAHGRQDRRGVRRRRLPRRGDSREEARSDQGSAGGRPDDRDDRRRHERRSGPRAGRCRRDHEHRYPGRARGGKHGRSRLESHEADRDRRGWQAAADHPRSVDHVLDRQRRRQVLRDPAGDLRGDLCHQRRRRARSTSSTSWIWARPSRRSSRRSSSTR